jgi:phosphonate transport system permease protein
MSFVPKDKAILEPDPRALFGAFVQFSGYWQRFTLLLLLVALLCGYFADTEIIALEPWAELKRMGQGLISADFFATEYLAQALWQTISFALLGVSLGLVLGAPLALMYHHPWVAMSCAFIRAIHEIFWAILFLQIFGLSPLTGVLAIALPYGATFARVFYDILSLAPTATLAVLPVNADSLSRFFYLESAFKQGRYDQGFALLILFIVLIGTLPLWCKKAFIPLYLLAAIYFLPPLPDINSQLIWQFLSHDILPPMLQSSLADTLGSSNSLLDHFGVLGELWEWFLALVLTQVLPSIGATLLLAVSALGLTHLCTLFLLPFNLPQLMKPWTLWPIKGLMLILRSVPEYLLAFLFMLLLGPSMLPAILALALHNSGLIVFLSARQGKNLTTSENFKPKWDHYSYEILPRLYPNFMGLLFYRFEVIIRETAILGMLGVATLGFYVDSNFSEIRYSGALVLLCFTALLNVLVDLMARRVLRSSLALSSQSAHRSC